MNSIDGEIWVDVEGFEGLYMISNHGRVYSLITSKMRKTKKNNRKYHQITLNKDKEQHYFLLHRLVASHFIESPDDYPQVNHIDEDKDNNKANNLEWVTNLQNCNHGTRNERLSKTEGLKRQIEENRVEVIGISVDEKIEVKFKEINLSRRMGYSPEHIHKACRGELEIYKGMKWRYGDKNM